MAVPLSEITAETVARQFLTHWVANFGVPTVVTTDRGAQFESQLFHELTCLLGTKRIRTTSYHPSANGMVERLHRQLKAALMAHGDTIHWVDTLPLVLLGLRCSVKADLGFSSAELVYGTTLKLPGDYAAPEGKFDATAVSDLVPRLRRAIANFVYTPTREQHTDYYIPKDLLTSSHVLVRVDGVKKPLNPPYEGPFEVTKRLSKFYVILRNGKAETVSIDRLKPAFIESDNPSRQPLSSNQEPEKSVTTAKKYKRKSGPRQPTNSQPRFTRTGRVVRSPDRFIYYQ
jgi:hypothetical protein